MLNQSNEREVYGSGRFTFPVKLHALLCQAAEFQVDGVISWDKTGMKFIIHNEGKFVISILPNIFEQSKFSSFRRQLNAYGFQRESKNLDTTLVFSHKHFRRDKPRACRRITRQAAKPPYFSNETIPNCSNRDSKNKNKTQQASLIKEISSRSSTRAFDNQYWKQKTFAKTKDGLVSTLITGDTVLDGLVEELFDDDTETYQKCNLSTDFIPWDTSKEEEISSNFPNS